MPLLPRLVLCVGFVGFSSGSAFAADPVPAPRPWEPNAFLPLTEARINALPAAEQPAWRAYWQNSASHARPAMRPTDPVENKSTPLGNSAPIPAVYSTRLRLNAARAWYGSAEARALADHIAAWQRPSGGWTKGGVYTRDPLPSDDHHDGWSAGTFDNDSTIYELRFLALVLTAAADDPGAVGWRRAFDRGLAYIFNAQYPNGGFPQIYPLAGEYHDAITFNDDAMVHILELLRDCAARQHEFAFIEPAVAAEAGERMRRGVECVLATQLRDASGHPTIWGQQHDALTLKPCAARNFEPIAECSNESVGLTLFLMSIERPSPSVVAAVEGAMAWFQQRALHGVVWDRHSAENLGLVPKAGAPDLWARFYEIGTGKPVFGDRDRTIHYAVGEISAERRQGYGWYNTRGTELPAAYAQWKSSRLR